MPILTREPDGPYYSPGDERAFFEWAERISCVKKIEGCGEVLRLHVASRRIAARCLRELIGLFERYGVEMSQLAQFESPANRAWFRAPAAYWHDAVFGAASRHVRRSVAVTAPRRTATRARRQTGSRG
jgi:hypothetical protein